MTSFFQHIISTSRQDWTRADLMWFLKAHRETYSTLVLRNSCILTSLSTLNPRALFFHTGPSISHGKVLPVSTSAPPLPTALDIHSLSLPLHIVLLMGSFAQVLLHHFLNLRFLRKPRPLITQSLQILYLLSIIIILHLGFTGKGGGGVGKFHNLLQGFRCLVLLSSPICKFQSSGLHPQNITFLWHKQLG